MGSHPVLSIQYNKFEFPYLCPFSCCEGLEAECIIVRRRNSLQHHSKHELTNFCTVLFSPLVKKKPGWNETHATSTHLLAEQVMKCQATAIFTLKPKLFQTNHMNRTGDGLLPHCFLGKDNCNIYMLWYRHKGRMLSTHVLTTTRKWGNEWVL